MDKNQGSDKATGGKQTIELLAQLKRKKKKR